MVRPVAVVASSAGNHGLGVAFAAKHFGVPATCRASLAFYNTRADIDRLVAGITKVRQLLG